MHPDSLPRLWRYINLLLAYLLTSQRLATVHCNEEDCPTEENANTWKHRHMARSRGSIELRFRMDAA